MVIREKDIECEHWWLELVLSSFPFLFRDVPGERNGRCIGNVQYSPYMSSLHACLESGRRAPIVDASNGP